MPFNNDTDMYICLSESSFKCFLKHVVSLNFLNNVFRILLYETRASKERKVLNQNTGFQSLRHLSSKQNDLCTFQYITRISKKKLPLNLKNLILNFMFKQYAFVKREYKKKKKMFRFHAKTNPSFSPNALYLII